MVKIVRISAITLLFLALTSLVLYYAIPHRHVISLAVFPRTNIQVNGVMLTGNIDSGCDMLCLPVELSRELHVPVGSPQAAHTAWGDERMLISTLPVQFDAVHRSPGTVVALYARNDFILIGTTPICDCGEVLFM